MTRKNILLTLGVFIFSICLSAYPIHQKGYALWGDDLNLIEARNAAQGGTYAYEDPNGVFLSSAHTKSAIPTAIPNSLTPILYRYIFKWFGNNPQLPLDISVVSFALFNAFVCWLGIKLFSPKVGFAAGLISASVPEMLVGSISQGGYEFALLFFALAVGIYLFSSSEIFKASRTRLILASVFFALAALARNAFAISFIPFVLYDFWVHRSIKRSALFLTPFLIIFGLTLTSYSWLPLPNGYTSTTNQPFQQVGHFFNDPYTYHFNAEPTVQEALSNPGSIDRVSAHFLSHWGYHVPLKQTVKSFVDAAIFYLQTLADMIQTGGPLLWLLVLAGGYSLWKNHRRFVEFSFLWLAVWYIALIAIQTGNNDHIIEIMLPLSLLAGVGVVEITKSFYNKKVFYIIALGLILGQFFFADKWRLYDSYRSSKSGLVNAIVTQVPVNTISGVIAIGIHPDAAYQFAYLTNHDVIYFHPDTIQELLTQKKLKSVLNSYGVREVIGYSPALSSEITSQTGIPTVAVSQ